MSNFEKISTEVLAVLKEIPKSQFDKIPPKVIEMFEKNKSHTNEIKIDTNKKLEEQNISKEAKDIIFLLGLNYWLTEEERKEVLIKLNENEKALKEKYNVENLLKTNKSEQKDLKEFEQEQELTEYKEGFFTKIVNKIKSYFIK